MEDQFGGRTDDDLFYDDFEPVDSEPVVIDETPKPVPEPAAPASSNLTQGHQSESTPAVTLPPRGGLGQSRYADPPSPQPPVDAPTRPKDQAQPSKASNEQPTSVPTGPRGKKPQRSPGQNSGQSSNPARAGSGANPRQKLTEDELAAKMEKMKVISAEKTRKFEKAEEDEKQHAQAFARGMEEARRRKADIEERRKRGEENQRQLNNEREKNRERKLKAMSQKNGGWDEGKEAMEEEEARRSFKGANGGIRGSRQGDLGGSRYVRNDGEVPDVDRFLDEDHPSRRGKSRGGRRGRGGRGGIEARPARTPEQKQEVPTTEDFPALPSDNSKKTGTDEKPGPPPQVALPPLVPGSKWGDEMEDLDDSTQKAQ